jgi:DNA polymerase-2
LWRFLQQQPVPLELGREERRDLFLSRPLPVLAARLLNAADQPALFQQVAAAFPDLAFYDADIPLHLRFAAQTGVFPLAYCQVQAGEDGRIHHIAALDSPWDLDPPPAPLRILRLEPDVDPAHRPPSHLLVACGRFNCRLALQPERPLLINLRALLQRHDPDLLLTAWGDTWLLPHLLELAEKWELPLPLNREAGRPVELHKERSYFSYGQVIYRGRQVHLFGRCHIDRGNAMLWDDYELQGVLESARVTSLPLQTAARVSPGTGISSMQMLTALRQGILIPWHKQQVESPKRAAELFAADQGGLVYQPLVGLHRDVGAIDFVSMYPGVMVRFNISPETVGASRPDPGRLSEVAPFPYEPAAAPLLAFAAGMASPSEAGAPVFRVGSGLVPQTLAPLLKKRVALKTRLAQLPGWDPRRKLYKRRASAQKWLLVTCFGYLGYKNARFGRIEAHEAVTAYGREALLRAKEAAEDLGFTVLHMYVDGLWVQKPGARQVADFQPILDEILQRTGLPVALDGVYRWVAFLPSRVDARLPVPNRYFGAFQDGSLKVRGVEARRHDTPPFIAEAQMELIEALARWPEVPLEACLAQAQRLLGRRLALLRQGRLPLEALVVRQKLSRALEEYRLPSPPARAALQLQAVGRRLRAGQSVRFLYTRGEPGVRAWDLPEPPDPRSVDVPRYTELLLRAAESVLAPFGALEQFQSQRSFAALRGGERGDRIGPG